MNTTSLNQGKCRRKLASLGSGICLGTYAFLGGISTGEAAPIIDTFQDLGNVAVVLDSATLSNSSGPLTITAALTTPPDTYGAYGKAIINWFNPGYGYFSLDLADEQFVFGFTGGQPLPSQSTGIMDIAFYIAGTGVTQKTLTTGPITPVNGEWHFNVYEAAQAAYGGTVPTGAIWRPEIYLGPAANGAGYSFDSFQATAVPEPHLTALLAIAGGVFFAFRFSRSFRNSTLS